jgi:hypothetical protein
MIAVEQQHSLRLNGRMMFTLKSQIPQDQIWEWLMFIG